MVFKGIKQIWKYLCFFFAAKKTWHRPKQSDVLIYDAVGQDILLVYFKPWHPEVLHVRGEQINLSVLFSSLFKSGTIMTAYTNCFIEKVRPRLVITFTDNNWDFYTISQRHPEIKTLFIQNGWRGYGMDIFSRIDKVNPDILSNYFVDYMLLFGPVICEKYAQYIRGHTVPMGSIGNNLIHKERLPEQGMIAFVSQWHPDGACLEGVSFTHEEFFEQPDRLIIQCLIRYAEKKNKQLMIILRNPKHSNLRAKEESYFRKLLGCEPKFFSPEGFYSGLQAVDSAEVVVSVNSTLAYESIARGNKTAIFSIRADLLKTSDATFGWPKDLPDEGLFWTRRPDPDSFVRILDYLFEVDDAQWRKDIETINFSSLMVYNPGNTILKSVLEEALGTTPPL